MRDAALARLPLFIFFSDIHVCCAKAYIFIAFTGAVSILPPLPLSIPPRTSKSAHVCRYSFSFSFHDFQMKVAELSSPCLAGALSTSIMIVLLRFSLRSVSRRDLFLAFKLCVRFRALFPFLWRACAADVAAFFFYV